MNMPGPPFVLGVLVAIDGDTATMDGKSFRLLGFDTPETFHAMRHSEYEMGTRPGSCLKKSPPSAAVLEPTGKSCKYGRECAYLRRKWRGRGGDPDPGGPRRAQWAQEGLVLMTRRATLAFLLLMSGAANAADITIEPDPSRKDRTLVLLKDRIEPKDGEKFKTLAGHLTGAVLVAFASPGGKMLDAMQIGRMIRMKGWATSVPPGATCSSACALAWLGGTTRYMWQTARVGFHAAYNKKDDGAEISAPGNALVGAYLNELGLGPDAIYYITFTDPKSMKWLSAVDAAKLGISMQMMKDDDVPFQMPAPVQAPPTAVEAKQKPAVPKETPNNPATQSTATVPTPTPPPAPKRTLWTLSMYAIVPQWGLPREGTLRSVDLQDFDSREACQRARLAAVRKIHEKLSAYAVVAPRTRCMEKRREDKEQKAATPVPPPAEAPADPPNQSAQSSFRVVGVDLDDVLHVRNGPSADHIVIGRLPPDADGIRIVGACVSAWCPIQHRGLSGWVNSFYLKPSP